MAAIRGRPSPTAITSLMRETGVGAREIKAWFTNERKALGHAGHGGAPYKEATPSVEVRARLPTPTRRPLSAAAYASSRKEEYTDGREGEYFEEEMKVDVIPPWLDPPMGGVTLYAYGGEARAVPGFAILDTALLLDRTDAESQDCGFGCVRTTVDQSSEIWTLR